MIQLDHIIVFCSPGVPEAPALRARGLVDTSGQIHAGQGTANRRFFLRLHLPQAAHPSDAILKLISAGLLSIDTASDYCMELTFLGSRTEPIDLRPRLPLVFLPGIGTKNKS